MIVREFSAVVEVFVDQDLSVHDALVGEWLKGFEFWSGENGFVIQRSIFKSSLYPFVVDGASGG